MPPISLQLCFCLLQVMLASGQLTTPLWVYDAEAPIVSSPALSPSGTVYVAAGAQQASLYAVANSGSAASNKWVFPLPANGRIGYGSPAVGPDGTIYIAGGTLYALRPDGTLKWSYPSVGVACPAVGSDGTIYMQGDAYLYAIAQDGTLRWESAGGSVSVFSSPVVGSDGSIYVASRAGYTLYGFRPDGTQNWSAPIGTVGFWPGESPALGRDGTIYTTASALYAFSPEGVNLWINHGPIYNQCFSPSPAVGQDGTVYVSTFLSFGFGYGLSLYAIDPAGTLKWNLSTNLNGGPCLFVSTPTIDGASNILVTAQNDLFVITPRGEILCSFSPGDGAVSGTSPLIGPDRTLYATFGTKLYALGWTNGLADSPWPMYRQNARHTGRVEKPLLNKPHKRPDANIDLQLFGQVDSTFTIQESTDLATWTSLTSFVATTFPAEVADLTATNSPVKFYRTMEGP